ncbi:MAG: PAS domain S-box protein [Ignavibacteriae bacterium]|nr:PAS domain S-box protein [Ignavibacteriota bacterium]
MRPFRDVPIKRKLTAIIMLTSSVALVLASVAILSYELITFRRAMVSELSSLAKIIGANSTAALTFHDKKSAEETLDALRANEHIVSACIYTPDGTVFATYFRDSATTGQIPPAPQEESVQFNKNYLTLSLPIFLNGERIGAVYIQSDLEEMYSAMKQYIVIILGVLLLSSFTALFLSSKLQRVISGPILHLAQLARRISSERNYTLRAVSKSNDEVGTLIDGFNQMLEQIRLRDAALQTAADELEKRVEQRTRELQEEINERKRAEEKIKKSEMLLSEAQQVSHLGSWEWDIPTDTVTWSDELYRLYGIEPHSISINYESFLMRVHPEDRSFIDETVRRSYESHEPFAFDHRIVLPDGGIRWLYGRGRVIVDGSGKAIRMMGTSQDITERKLAEENVRKLQLRYHSLTEAASDAIISINEHSEIIFANRATGRIFGYSMEELQGQDLTMLMPDYLRALHKQGFRHYLETRTRHLDWEHTELKGLRKDGLEIPVELSLAEYTDEGHRYFIGIVRDIAERKRAEDTLRESETRFRSVWENSADGMRLTDENGTIVAVNDAFSKIVGMESAELVGQPITITYYGDKDVGNMLWLYRKRFEERTMEIHTERIITLRSGKTVYVEASHSFIELENRKAFLLGIFRDITERKLAEQRLQMLAHTITSLNDCVCITDLNNTIISVNQAFLTTYGYEEHEIRGKNVTVLRSPNNPESLTEEIVRAALKGGWSGELMNVRKNGEEFPIILSSSVVRDSNGTPVALVGISRDITEQKNLQRKLDEIARQRTEDLVKFATSIQSAQEEERRRIARELHDDLGQRLSGMKFNIEVFEEAIPKTDKATISKLNQLKQQIDTMLTEIRRISSNLHPAALDDFGLLVALQLLCKEFEKIHRIKVKLHSPDTRMVRYDPHVEIALYRITQEALSNVAKHAAATAVSIQLAYHNNTLYLSIEDNGKGFDVNSIRTERATDRGLGLISMKERAEYIGARYSIESQPDRGTTIQVEIPL